MAMSRASHRLVCVGVSALSLCALAEKNARAVFSRLTGALGPPRVEARCLLGGEATQAAMERVLAEAIAAPSRFLVVYFSGEVGARGLKLADGTLAAALLGSALAQMESTRTLFLLDLFTRRPLRSGPEIPAWLDELVATLPLVRIAAAPGVAIGAGARGHGLSRFTAAYLEALRRAPADMKHGGQPFVSDRHAFTEAAAAMRRRWGAASQPIEIGVCGGIPLLRSEAPGAVGAGQIKRLSAGPGLSLRVRYALRGRRNTPTVLAYLLIDMSDEPLSEGYVELIPTSDEHVGHTSIRVRASQLRGHPPGDGPGHTLRLRWQVELRDAFGHRLARSELDIEYSALSRG
jgi:hypothetical protein